MSLVGSLEDLGLGDILQIITLSRKSGALLLRSESGEGRVLFRDGLVCGARVKGRTPDLRRLLLDGGHLSEERFEALRSDAAARKLALPTALAEALTPERFEGLRRECVERAVLDMFGWQTGEFSFEVGEESPDDECEVVLESGINAQYLAMEGTRRNDEETRQPAVAADDPASFADVAEEIAAGDAPADAFEAVALTTVERMDRAEPLESTTEDEVEEALEAAIVRAAAESDASEEEPAEARRAEPSRRKSLRGVKLPPVVVAAPELPVLEWVKRTLEGTFRRVHIFQKAELAVQRLRQYMAKGDFPLVLVSPALAIEESGIFRDVDDLVARMKKQSPRSPVLWLGERDESGSADGAVPCPPAQEAASPVGPPPELDDALREGVLGALGHGAPAARGSGAARSAKRSRPSASSRARTVSPGLASVTARLDDPRTRGEVLNVVLQFAAEHFARVALFAVRDGEACGLAGLGLEQAGGPDDAALREVELTVAESRWLAAVVETQAAVRAAPDGPGDRRLAARLGDGAAQEAWLGPVISGDRVVAILYADNLPGGAPLRESDDLEAALAHAGRVLERAVEERARSAG